MKMNKQLFAVSVVKTYFAKLDPELISLNYVALKLFVTHCVCIQRETVLLLHVMELNYTMFVFFKAYYRMLQLSFMVYHVT